MRLAHPASGEREELRQFAVVEGPALGGGLHFDEAAAAGHDDVHVDFGARIFFVAEVEHGHAGDRCRRWWRRPSR